MSCSKPVVFNLVASYICRFILVDQIRYLVGPNSITDMAAIATIIWVTRIKADQYHKSSVHPLKTRQFSRRNIDLS
jgi:hypothetical protein